MRHETFVIHNDEHHIQSESLFVVCRVYLPKQYTISVWPQSRGDPKRLNVWALGALYIHNILFANEW